MSLTQDMMIAGIRGIKFDPEITNSKTYTQWTSIWGPSTCKGCKDMHGKIYTAGEEFPDDEEERIPLHPNCRCYLSPLENIKKGTATYDAGNGADVWMVNNDVLPENYIDKDQAINMGWEPRQGNLALVADGKIIGGNEYLNKNGHLPSSPGRIWYEADVNYTGGYRNESRLMYSNDGLVFITYDHYFNFYQIID